MRQEEKKEMIRKRRKEKDRSFSKHGFSEAITSYRVDHLTTEMEHAVKIILVFTSQFVRCCWEFFIASSTRTEGKFF